MEHLVGDVLVLPETPTFVGTNERSVPPTPFQILNSLIEKRRKRNGTQVPKSTKPYFISAYLNSCYVYHILDEKRWPDIPAIEPVY